MNHYGLRLSDPRNFPDSTPKAEQVKKAPRASDKQRSKLFDSGLIARITHLRYELKGRARRISDGALVPLSGTITTDYYDDFKRADCQIRVPINPDCGPLVGNVINSIWCVVEGSCWIHSCGPVTRTPADEAWDALGVHRQIEELICGKVMYAHDGTAWEITVDDFEINPIVSHLVPKQEETPWKQRAGKSTTPD